MWENAAKHTDTPPAPPAAAEPGEYDTLLWAQIILCVLIAVGVFAARALELPLYSTLRTDYRYALAQPGPDFWNTDGSRNVVRFTQETFAELRGVLRQVAAQTPETAARTGTAHGQPLASAEAYLPGVMLQYPLPGKPAVETSAYGTRIDPVQGKTQEFHTGADLSAVQGTPVHAAASGVVRIARNHASYGNYVRLLHPAGMKRSMPICNTCLSARVSRFRRGSAWAPWGRPATPPARTCTLSFCTPVCGMTQPGPLPKRVSRRNHEAAAPHFSRPYRAPGLDTLSPRFGAGR